jgi:aldehyde:ferredoxin oxidoreductase
MKAEKPVYVSIKDGKINFRSAAKLIGMMTTDTQLFIKEELGDWNYRIACIGPAGERQVPIACIVNERRAAGRKGLEALLGQGTKKAAEKVGEGSIDLAMQIKGLEMPAYDIRGAKAHGLNYATAYTGADHNRGYAFQEIFDIPIPGKVDRNAIKGKGKLTKWNQDVRAVTCDCAPMCAFLLDMAVPAVACQNTADLVNAVAGTSFTSADIQKIGERLNNIARLFNIREGFTRKDDSFPKRIMTESIKGGASKGQLISQADLDSMLDEYYKERGWDESGTPMPAKLKELGVKK